MLKATGTLLAISLLSFRLNAGTGPSHPSNGHWTPQNQKLNVKDFGATGDGVTDDSKAFISCLDEAVKDKINFIVVPYGKYKVSSPVQASKPFDMDLDISGIEQDGQQPIIFTNQFINIIKIQGYAVNALGRIHISNLHVIGNNVPFSSSHPYYNKAGFVTGIGVFNKKFCEISNCIVENVYGQGIYIGSDLFSKNAANNRFDTLIIRNNFIKNSWGLHPTPDKNGAYDEYGDGMYLNNINYALIENNKVINDLRYTGQFGRGGIVVEFNSKNFTITHNVISGYDRDMHLEVDHGGHTISDNMLYGTDFGILMFNLCTTNTEPSIIENNKISNEGIPDISTLTPLRAKDERSLISIEYRGDCVIPFKLLNNQLTITRNSKLISTNAIRLLVSGVDLEGNQIMTDVGSSGQKPRLLFEGTSYTSRNNMFRGLGIYVKNADQASIVTGNNNGNQFVDTYTIKNL
jgi:hypothetical protein